MVIDGTLTSSWINIIQRATGEHVERYVGKCCYITSWLQLHSVPRFEYSKTLIENRSDLLKPISWTNGKQTLDFFINQLAVFNANRCLTENFSRFHPIEVSTSERDIQTRHMCLGKNKRRVLWFLCHLLMIRWTNFILSWSAGVRINIRRIEIAFLYSRSLSSSLFHCLFFLIVILFAVWLLNVCIVAAIVYNFAFLFTFYCCHIVVLCCSVC